jgi:catechol 2,3-dioxygenase-like lactoylglutathione lyase family enzyme
MQLRYVVLYVADVGASMAFYSRAFGLTVGFLHDDGDYGEMATGETRLAFSRLGQNRVTDTAVAPALPACGLAFATDELAAALDRALAAGAVLVQHATAMPWGQTICYVRAPEGTLVELCAETR